MSLRDGIFVFFGSTFKVGPAATKGHVMDIPATLLHLNGVPIPEDYDGRVLTELFASELGQQPVHYQPGDVDVCDSTDEAYSTEEVEELMSHLRALGYLDQFSLRFCNKGQKSPKMDRTLSVVSINKFHKT